MRYNLFIKKENNKIYSPINQAFLKNNKHKIITMKLQ